jgi:hypothetical protein
VSSPGPYGIDRIDLMVGPSCASCGAERVALNGRPLGLGEKCDCGSRAIRVPRRPGQVVGDVIEFPQQNGEAA